MSSGFITETEILEQRRRRQEEWEKVRTADQPIEAPEEAPYDSRPLFQRLEEQRLKKDAEYEEAHKLKNMIRGLDDDEVGFLDLVEQTKAKAALQISMEEQKEMQEFRERVNNLTETEEIQRLRAQLAPARPAQSQQNPKNKLQGMVVRKRKASDMEESKDAPSAKSNGMVNSNTEIEPEPRNNGTPNDIGSLRCVGVLPGLGHYDTDSSSDTDHSSDVESDNPGTMAHLMVSVHCGAWECFPVWDIMILTPRATPTIPAMWSLIVTNAVQRETYSVAARSKRQKLRKKKKQRVR